MNESPQHSSKRDRLTSQPRVRVLIADDRRRSRLGLKALLATFPQIQVVGEAANGREALDLASQCAPDVVLMDILMPVMDGLEAARCIKNAWPGVRIVILTLHASYRGQARAAGADAFLVKGGPADELLRNLLGHK
jgi:NarL family two-component system response regulator LiaR